MWYGSIVLMQCAAHGEGIRTHDCGRVRTTRSSARFYVEERDDLSVSRELLGMNRSAGGAAAWCG